MRIALVVLLILFLSRFSRPEEPARREFAIRIQGLAGDGPSADAPVGVVPIGDVTPIPGGAE